MPIAVHHSPAAPSHGRGGMLGGWRMAGLVPIALSCEVGEGTRSSARLLRLLPDARPQCFSVFAVWQRNRQLSPKVPHVVEALSTRCADLPWSSAGP